MVFSRGKRSPASARGPRSEPDLHATSTPDGSDSNLIREYRAEQERSNKARSRQRAADLRGGDSRYRRTAPVGAPASVAVEAHLSRDLGTIADSWRQDFTKLAVKHMRPQERVVGLRVLSGAPRRVGVIAFSSGYAVKLGALTYRVDRPTFASGDGSMSVVLGDEAVRIPRDDSWFRQIERTRDHLRSEPPPAATTTRKAPREPRRPRPAPRLIRQARDAELVAAEWMQVMGFDDARATGEGADGGIDVLAAKAIAQVKAEARPVGRPVLQQLVGAAHSMRRTALCFALAGFTPQALAWADGQDLALFSFDLQGVPDPVNRAAHELFARSKADGGASTAATTGVFHHGTCMIRHRTPQAAALCRKG